MSVGAEPEREVVALANGVYVVVTFASGMPLVVDIVAPLLGVVVPLKLTKHTARTLRAVLNLFIQSPENATRPSSG